ncbi:E14 prophage [Enterobacter sp. FY-07]|nr:E14 prophage [Enterobacter sp. FY-07]
MRHKHNHRIKGVTVGNDHWKVEKQPAWLVAAIRKTIAALPGGYAEAAEIIDVTEDALFNRLRAGGDQIFPMGWAMILQKAAGVSYIADAFSRETDNGIHISGAAPEDENEEIGLKLAELVGQLGELVNAYRQYIDDGVVTHGEWQSLNDIAYQFRVTLMTFLNLISRVYCLPEKDDASGLQPLASWRVDRCGDTNA